MYFNYYSKTIEITIIMCSEQRKESLSDLRISVPVDHKMKVTDIQKWKITDFCLERKNVEHYR